MKKWALTIGVLLFSLMAIVLVYFYGDGTSEEVTIEPAIYPIERNIRYSYTVKNTSQKFIEETEFWSYLPVKQTSSQKTITTQSSSVYSVTTDQQGNQKAWFKIKKLPPYGTKTITIDVELGMSIEPNYLSEPSDRTVYLSSEPHVELNSEKVKVLARKLKRKLPIESIKSSYEWVVNNLSDAGYIRNDRGALYAINTKTGDCTEYMYLFTALSRSNGVPTRGVSGFVVKEDAVLKSHNYHNWAVSLIDERWQLIDPHKQTYLSEGSNYIAMRLLGGHGSTMTDSSQTLFGGGKGISITMN